MATSVLAISAERRTAARTRNVSRVSLSRRPCLPAPFRGYQNLDVAATISDARFPIDCFSGPALAERDHGSVEVSRHHRKNCWHRWWTAMFRNACLRGNISVVSRFKANRTLSMSLAIHQVSGLICRSREADPFLVPRVQGHVDWSNLKSTCRGFEDAFHGYRFQALQIVSITLSRARFRCHDEQSYVFIFDDRSIGYGRRCSRLKFILIRE